MTTTVPNPGASTRVPPVSARLRLPRHHAAARDIAIADLAATVQTLIERVESVGPISAPYSPAPAAPPQTCQCDWHNAVNHAEIVAWLNTTDAAEMLAFIDWATDFGCINEDERTDALLEHYGFEVAAEVGNRWPIFPGDLDHIAKAHHLADSVHTFNVLDHIRWSIQTQTSLRKRIRDEMAAHASMDRIEGTMSAITEELSGLGESIVGLSKLVDEVEARAAEVDQ